MKKIALIFTMFLGVSTLLNAQNQKAASQENAAVSIDEAAIAREAKTETDKLDAALNFSPDQRKKMIELNKEIARKRAYMKAHTMQTPEDLQKIENLKIEMYTSVFTKDQIVKFRQQYLK